MPCKDSHYKTMKIRYSMIIYKYLKIDHFIPISLMKTKCKTVRCNRLVTIQSYINLLLTSIS